MLDRRSSKGTETEPCPGFIVPEYRSSKRPPALFEGLSTGEGCGVGLSTGVAEGDGLGDGLSTGVAVGVGVGEGSVLPPFNSKSLPLA